MTYSAEYLAWVRSLGPDKCAVGPADAWNAAWQVAQEAQREKIKSRIGLLEGWVPEDWVSVQDVLAYSPLTKQTLTELVGILIGEGNDR